MVFKKGEYNPMKDEKLKKQIIETWKLNGNSERISKRMKINNPMQNPEIAKRTGLKQREIGHYDKISKLMKEGGAIKARMAKEEKESNTERELEILFSNADIKIEYVGSGKIWFKGRTQYFNPDFIDFDNRKIIELFGEYWHKNSVEDDKERLEIYLENGYDTLIIWERELKNKEMLIEKVRRFLYG